MAKIGIEWVQNYHSAGADLHSTREQAERFWNTLSGEKAFNFGDDLAWDTDFEEQGAGSPAAGGDQLFVDTVAITFFSGHGSSAGASFGIATHDNKRASPSEMRLGNGAANWVVFDACEVLQEQGVEQRFSNVFQGLHYVLGFHSTSSDESKRGGIFADHLNHGERMRDAWRKACQETEESDRVWAYLRASTQGAETFPDHWHGRGEVSADPVGNVELTYFHQTC
jgi:hypothetical protein